MSENKSDFPLVPTRKLEPKSQPKIIIRPSAVMLNPKLKQFVLVNKGLAKNKPVILEDAVIIPSQSVNRSTSIENDSKCIELSPSKLNPKTVIEKNTAIKHVSKLSNMRSSTQTQGSITQSSQSSTNFSKLSSISKAKDIPELFKMPQPYEAKTRMKNMAINYKPALNIRCFKAVCTAPDGKTEIRTADNLINMIGEMQFDVLMSALLSVKNDDLRNRAILSFLTPRNNPTQSRSDVATQTVEIVPAIDRAQRDKRKPFRRRQQPYALEENTKPLIIKKTIIDPFTNSEVVDFCKPEEKQTLSEENSLGLDNIIDTSDVISHVSPPNSISSIPLSLMNKSVSEIVKGFDKFFSTDTDMPTCISETEPKSSNSCNVSIGNETNTGQKCENSTMQMDNSKNRISDFESSQRGSVLYVSTMPNTPSSLGDTLVPNSNQVTSKTMNTSVIPNSNINKTTNTPILNSNVASETLENRDLHQDEEDRTPFNIDTATYTSILGDLEPEGRELLKAVNPKDWFHIASPSRLKMLPLEKRKKLVELQMYIDMKFCLIADEDNYLPIHNAVLNNDEDLLRRQCYILKANQQSIDIGDAEFNLSALQMCIKYSAPPHLAKVLLDLGACPLTPDDEDRSAIHLAAEVAQHEYLEMMLESMAANPRYYLQMAELETDDTIGDDQKALIDSLFSHAVSAFDSRGYTPLMLAADLGHYEQVMRLLEQLSDTQRAVNQQSPTSNDTALHLAVVGACKQAERNGDLSKVPDNYVNTISQLIRYGADPWMENKYGVTINSIICEFRFQALFKLLNTALGETKLRHINTEITITSDNAKIIENLSFSGREPFIIVKKENGTFDYCNPKDNLRKKNDRKDVDKEKNKSKRLGRKRKRSEKSSGEEGVCVDVNSLEDVNKVNAKSTSDELNQSHVEKKQKIIVIDQSTIDKLIFETEKESRNIPAILLSSQQDKKVLNLNVPHSESPLQHNPHKLVYSNKNTTNQIIASVQNKTIPSTSTALNSKTDILNNLPTTSADLIKTLDIKQIKVKVLSVIAPKGEGDRKLTINTKPEYVGTINATVSNSQSDTTKVLEAISKSADSLAVSATVNCVENNNLKR